MTDRRVQLSLFAGLSLESLVEAALASLPENRDSVVVAAASRLSEDVFIHLVKQIFRNRSRDVSMLIAPGSTPAAWRRLRSTRWREIEVGARASRLSRVKLPHDLANAADIIALSSVTRNESSNEPIVLGLWAAFAHPGQRFGAQLSNPRQGLTAEIALAVEPGLIMLLAIHDQFPVIVATSDQIAAELAGLALRQSLGWSAVATGPWEHPLVQHATELKIGISTPAQIDSSASWLGEPNGPDERIFATLAVEVFGRIGVDLGRG